MNKQLPKLNAKEFEIVTYLNRNNFTVYDYIKCLFEECEPTNFHIGGFYPTYNYIKYNPFIRKDVSILNAIRYHASDLKALHKKIMN